MKLTSLKSNIRNNIKNLPGWRTKRKIVVFESDDWGSNRIVSKEHYEKLLEEGVAVDRSAYNKYDTIERSSDIEALFEILSSVKDKSARHALFTPFVNPVNPDFKKIGESGYKEYHYESFDQTLAAYGEKESVLRLYKEGMEANLFEPQFHGREHLTVSLWLQSLQRGNGKIREAFDQKFYAYPDRNLNNIAGAFRPAFYFESNEEIPFLRESIREGMDIFEKLIGYRATVFDPPNGVFPEILEKDLLEAGIHTIVTNRVRPEPQGDGEVKKKYFTFGQVNNLGQTYYIRNCQFEPYDNRSVDHCLSMMKAAFRWGKPAIICTHRVNFNGGIDTKNRDKGLRELKELLDRMLKEWPDIEFMSSGEFAKLLRKETAV